MTEATKCNKILNKFVYPFKENSPGILCFQEVKFIQDSAKNFFRKLPSYWSVTSVNPGQAVALQGVTLSIHKSLNAIVLCKKTEKGWLILVKCRILDKVYVIGNVYMPSLCSIETYCEKLKLIESHLQHLKCDNVILQGNFNVDIDKPESKKSYRLALGQFLEK